VTPIGWIAVYDDGAGGEVIERSTDGVGKSPRDIPNAGCFGTRVIYRETTVADGVAIHYSDIWVGHDWVVFFEESPGVWNCRNSAVNDGRPDEGKEGISVDDTRWNRVMAQRFLNNNDNRVGQW